MKRMLLPLVFAACTAHAEYKDGNKLLSEMNGSIYDQMSSLGYVMGVADALYGVVVCNPTNATAGQMNDMIKRYLENNPSVRHYSADSLIARVLEQSWPCKKKGSGV